MAQTTNLHREHAYKKIKELAYRFEEQKPFYLQSNYNETQTRRDFIDPFFKALGWDIDNENGYAESYREVIHEDRVKVGNKNKAPDYSFRLVGGKRLFFVEAKKPSVLIKSETEPAFQVRRYGWSAKLPVSIITDFQEFAVYDCTRKPLLTDQASIARIKYLTYNDYLNDFGFLWDTFSKQRVLEGSFDKFVQNDTYKKGTATVDREFLQSLDTWRTQLAVSISKNNKQLDEDEINFAVQQTLDRIIFLRIAEDRSIEPYGNLKDCIKDGNLYQNLYTLFVKADEKYNSGLFDFNKDKISHKLEVENKVLKNILNDLYFPCPYEFSVLPVEILGTAYEQFLGKQIKIDKAHRVSIEEKPAVRKAGGVYYTPQYIVEYIVKNTIGKLVEGKTPKEIEKLKIVDPACGSGSFLLGAYEYLLNWHKDFYSQNGKVSKGRKTDTLTPEGNLTTAEKKRILLSNIYGVDLDINAVEVTKLSLLIKCMEGETEASIATQMRLFHDRILPTLDHNIKSGNSLIDTDYYDNELDFGDEKKIKPFNWQKAFPEVFKQGGFDVLIGNPPYVVLEGKQRNDLTLNYLRKKYKSASYKIDLYHLFIEKALFLLKPYGKSGYITPSNFLANNSLIGLRETILARSHIDMLNNISGKVFSGASVDTVIMILSKSNRKEECYFKNSSWENNILTETSEKQFNQNVFEENEGKIFISTERKQDFKIKKFNLGDFYYVKFGMQLRNRQIYTTDVITSHQKKEITKYHKSCYTGRDVNKWFMTYNDLLAYYHSEAKSGGCWDERIHFTKPKIIIRQIGKTPICAIDEKGYCCLNTVFMIVPKHNSELNLKYILAILNSNVIGHFWRQNFYDLRQTFPKIKGSYLEKLPISIIDFKKNDQKKTHDEIVKNVDLLLQLKEDLKSNALQSKIEQIQSKVNYYEDKINQLVYQLYNLTAEEIKTVEESLKA